MNVLYIVSDDARPEMPSFGQDYVKAPNLAALSARGLTFMNAYCQQSICSPSRNSFMSVRKQLTLALTLKPNLCPYPYAHPCSFYERTEAAANVLRSSKTLTGGGWSTTPQPPPGADPYWFGVASTHLCRSLMLTPLCTIPMLMPYIYIYKHNNNNNIMIEGEAATKHTSLELYQRLSSGISVPSVVPAIL